VAPALLGRSESPPFLPNKPCSFPLALLILTFRRRVLEGLLLLISRTIFPWRFSFDNKPASSLLLPRLYPAHGLFSGIFSLKPPLMASRDSHTFFPPPFRFLYESFFFFFEPRGFFLFCSVFSAWTFCSPFDEGGVVYFSCLGESLRALEFAFSSCPTVPFVLSCGVRCGS